MQASSAIVHALRYGNRSMHDADPASLVRRAYSALLELFQERYPAIALEHLDTLLRTENGLADMQRQIEDFGIAADIDVLLRIIELQDALARYPTPSAIGLAMENVRAERITISDIAVTHIQGKAPPAPGSPPYKGLSHFDVADAPLFFGREQLTAELIQRLWSNRFLAIVGASGSGKSSLVRAGLIPTLLGQKTPVNDTDLPPGSANWPYLIITPKEDGLTSLAQALLRKITGISLEKLLAELQADSTTLHRYAQQWVGEEKADTHLLLVIDQFEEVFRTPPEEADRQKEARHHQTEQRTHALIQNLLYTVENAGPVIVILTVRADFYDQCIGIEGLRRAFNGELANGSCQINVGPLEPDELRRVIEGPLTALDPISNTQHQWSIEPELVTQLLADVGREPGALPLLSHALLITWERRSGRTLTVAGYITTGRIQGAIAITADKVYENLKKRDEKELIRVLFLSMTRSLDGERVTSRQVHLDRTLADRTTAKQQDQVLEALQKARLVLVDRQGNGPDAGETVELAHEALTRVWPQLRTWMQEDREEQATYHRLLDGFQLWSTRKDTSDLYRGQRLQTAYSLLESEYRFVLDEHIREFLEKSRKREEIERQRVLLLIGMAGLAIVAVAVVFLGPIIWGQIQRKQAFALNPVVHLPAGDALLGSDDPAISRSYPQRPVTLSAFSIHMYEVSNKQYALCERACGLSNGAELLALGDTLPVVNVSVKQASLFCEWLGGRLPTESEWERAARGSEGRLWPWGDTFPPIPQQANIVFTPPPDALTAVNDPAYQSGATPDGIMHLVGNAAEWTATPASCERSAYCSEKWNGEDGVIVRGGSYTDDAGGLQLITAAWVYSGEPNRDIGFRCAFDE